MTRARHSQDRASIAEQLLGSWRLPNACEQRTENAVAQAFARIQNESAGTSSTLDGLLVSPLPAEEGEPGYDPLAPPSDVNHDMTTREPLVVASSVSHLGARTRRGVSQRWLIAVGTSCLAAAAILLLWSRDPELEEGAAPAALARLPDPGGPAVASVPAGEATEAAERATPPTPTAAAPPRYSQEEKGAAAPVAASEPRISRTRADHSKQPTEPESALPRGSAELEGPSPRMRPAAQAASLPDHPSTGEVHASLAKVLPGARSCLTSDQDPVVVHVVFASSGGVRHTTLRSSVPRHAKTCLMAALGRARVAPFARDAYGVDATVRPH